MTLRIDALNVDATDAATIGRWWAEVLGWQIGEEDADSLLIAPGVVDGATTGQAILFYDVPDVKVVKSRLHLDFTTDEPEKDIARLEAMGAVRVDIGQGDVRWVVMADPEGNEFCVLGVT